MGYIPTPFTKEDVRSEGTHVYWLIRERDGQKIAGVYQGDNDTEIADHLIKACNHFEEMREMLKRISDNFGGDRRTYFGAISGLDDLLNKIESENSDD